MSKWTTGNEIATIAAGALTNLFASNEFELVTPSGGISTVTFFIGRSIGTEADLIMRVGFRLETGGTIYWATYASGTFTLAPLEYTVPNTLGGAVPVDAWVNRRVANLVVQLKSSAPGGAPGEVTIKFAFDTLRGY